MVMLPRLTRPLLVCLSPPGQGAGEEHRCGGQLEGRRTSGVGQEERGSLLPAEGRWCAESQVSLWFFVVSCRCDVISWLWVVIIIIIIINY